MSALGQCGSGLMPGMMGSNAGNNGAIAIGGPGNNKYKDISGPITDSGKGTLTKSSTKVGKEGIIFSAGETKGAPDKAGASSVPYYEVYSDYKKSAEKALSKEEVPPAYRKPVKDYFESLRK